MLNCIYYKNKINTHAPHKHAKSKPALEIIVPDSCRHLSLIHIYRSRVIVQTGINTFKAYGLHRLIRSADDFIDHADPFFISQLICYHNHLSLRQLRGIYKKQQGKQKIYQQLFGIFQISVKGFVDGEDDKCAHHAVDKGQRDKGNIIVFTALRKIEGQKDIKEKNDTAEKSCQDVYKRQAGESAPIPVTAILLISITFLFSAA